MLLLLVPGYLAASRSRRDRSTDGLAMIRDVWLSFAVATVLFGVVVLSAVPGTSTSPAGPWLVGLGVVAASCLIAVRLFGRRALDCSSAVALAASYRTRFFARTAFSEAVALFAFVATFLTGQPWMYWVMMPFAFIGYGWNAPTRRQLEDEQQKLSLSGCSISLVRSLRDPSAAT
jgi:hypothetical protein